MEILKEAEREVDTKLKRKGSARKPPAGKDTKTWNVQSHHLRKPQDHSKYQRIQVWMRMEMGWWMNLTVNTQSVEKFLKNKVLLGYRATTVKSGTRWNVLALTNYDETALPDQYCAVSDSLLGLACMFHNGNNRFIIDTARQSS